MQELGSSCGRLSRRNRNKVKNGKRIRTKNQLMKKLDKVHSTISKVRGSIVWRILAFHLTVSSGNRCCCCATTIGQIRNLHWGYPLLEVKNKLQRHRNALFSIRFRCKTLKKTDRRVSFLETNTVFSSRKNCNCKWREASDRGRTF